MKVKYIKIITAIGLVSLLVIQLVWLFNSIQLTKDISKGEINLIIQEAAEEEALIRLRNTPKGTKIESPKVDKNINKIIYLEEGLSKLGYPIDILMIDSITGQLLKEKLHISDYNVYLINSNSQTVIEQSNRKDMEDVWYSIESDIFPITIDQSQGLKLTILNPHNIILNRLAVTLITTFALLLFCLIGLFKLGKSVISFENKKDFMDSMAHNLKAPIQTISMCIDSLHSERLGSNKELKDKYYLIIKKNLNHLSAFTSRNLFSFAFENNINQFDKETIELQSIINEIKDRFFIYNEKDVDLNINLECKKVLANRKLLLEIISNLIDNSLKYSKEQITITVSSYSDEKYDVIKVHDNGIGITHKNLNQIFKKFKQVSSKKQTYVGFGLGLTFVSQAMKLQKGKIEVNSQINEFTEFTLYFPKNK